MIADWRKSSRSGGVDDKYCVEVAQVTSSDDVAGRGEKT
ncbi:DUF397 domain-containing protein [Actinoallomurus purpureus]|nr:DUF397 domain-containing protein [Actinoallomurus purpureus]MCO6003401.1 DUF397 domain-containing protein [Actinoallomurus purpureus]